MLKRTGIGLALVSLLLLLAATPLSYRRDRIVEISLGGRKNPHGRQTNGWNFLRAIDGRVIDDNCRQLGTFPNIRRTDGGVTVV